MHNSVDRASVTYHGHVQGVGFRYTVLSHARNYQTVTGRVTNQSDGTVILIAEGTKEDIDSLLSDIYQSMSVHISEVIATWSRQPREFPTFAVGF